MKITKKESDELILSLNQDEMTAFSNALNESLEAIEDWEYQTRIGVTKTEMRSMLSQIR